MKPLPDLVDTPLPSGGPQHLRVVALTGGVGGAKLADGLAAILPATHLTVIVNTGDDFEHLGLLICPDLDTVTYTLAGLANPKTGWGRRDDSWRFLETLGTLGGPTWFRLGDRDLALHVERTRRIRSGESLTSVTRALSTSLGVRQQVLPMSDSPVRTKVRTSEGELPFQEYFVARLCEPKVEGFRFEGIDAARPAPGVLEALRGAQLVILSPSNPWVSLDPILAVPGIREAVGNRPTLAISPILGGTAVKGPAAKMYAEMGIGPSALAVYDHYRELLKGFVLDTVDRALAAEIEAAGMRVLVTNTLMKNRLGRRRLAQAVLNFACDHGLVGVGR